MRREGTMTHSQKNYFQSGNNGVEICICWTRWKLRDVSNHIVLETLKRFSCITSQMLAARDRGHPPILKWWKARERSTVLLSWANHELLHSRPLRFQDWNLPRVWQPSKSVSNWRRKYMRMKWHTTFGRTAKRYCHTLPTNQADSMFM